MKKITIAILIQELAKFGNLEFYQTTDDEGKRVMRNHYAIKGDFRDNAICHSIRQDTPDLRKFLTNCASCFEEDFNPVFDVLLKKL
jgi:hypothetical protein